MSLISDKPAPFVLWINGASGAGKTTVLRALEERLGTTWAFLHQDGGEEPLSEAAIEAAGSISNYQELLTFRWIEKAVRQHAGASVAVIDGQANFDFIEASCDRLGGVPFGVVLLDCDWATLRHRLIVEREQPELANQDMQNWSDFLRRQAQAKEVLIIDTSVNSVDGVADLVIEECRRLQCQI